MSLLHLDLTNNQLDLAGVMALNKGLKSNHVMRCLDLNIPPGDEAFAKCVCAFFNGVRFSKSISGCAERFSIPVFGIPRKQKGIPRPHL